ncbi:GntR family transcriptional regulator [Solirubrobacter sp. CPCC 204708]|nr:GntR family transcriptional regulator [Solirubrobacter deserti]
MVYETLREGILNGVFQPGERLRQDQLAEAIGVSRIPVRSALLQLESDGLITFNPYRGAVVNKLSSNEMREIYELRAVLEAHALRKAVDAMTPEKLAHLEQLAVELNAIQDGEEFLVRRNEFYRELYDNEHQARTVGLIERLRAEAGRYWLERKVDYVSRPGERDHLHLIEFIKAGDIESAVAWLEDHLQKVCDDLVGLMEKDAKTPA